jgi:hypothetical protein
LRKADTVDDLATSRTLRKADAVDDLATSRTLMKADTAEHFIMEDLAASKSIQENEGRNS